MSTDVAPVEDVNVTIDGVEVSVPKGTLVIRAAEQIGIHIPRFCDHPLLGPAGACRQCVVDVGTPGPDGEIRWMPKPQSSCTTTVSPGMVVKTQFTSPAAAKAQHGIMEFLLINHPLDCPVCDKGGECPLQNQAMSDGRGETRFRDVKRTFPKPVAVSTQILLDRERCILCQRCTRFAAEIAGDPFIALQMRGARQQVGTFDADRLGFAGDSPVGGALEDVTGAPFASYFSGNTIQICPVGALTSAMYRFRARPFDLVSTPSVAEHDASGSAIRIDHRRGVVLRRNALEDPDVNESWLTDKDRFAFTWQTASDRLTYPMVRVDGELQQVSWAEALQRAGQGLAGGAGVLTGGRMPIEDAYAYAKFARVVLGTNDIDFRARAHSAEETAFLGSHVAGSRLGVTFADLERAPAVLLVAFEAEEEGGVVFLRLRKGVKRGTKVTAVAPFASKGTAKLSATLIPAAPGTEAEVLAAIVADSDDEALAATAEALAAPKAVIIVGERLASVPGGYTAALALAERTGARLAWIPRRAGERGAVEAGALPTLLPGARPVTDATARVDVATVWGVGSVPTEPGRCGTAILRAAADGTVPALVVGGVELADLPDPALAAEALGKAFVVSLEVRASAVTDAADVVLPVAPPHERPGTFWNWEGRARPFSQALTTYALPEHRVLDMLAQQMGSSLGTGTLAAIHEEFGQFDAWDGAKAAAPEVEPGTPVEVGSGEAVLASWRMQLDDGLGQAGERFLAGTAKRPVARMSAKTAEVAGVSHGEGARIVSEHGSVSLPVVVTDMPDHVVWVPANSAGALATLGVAAGSVVRVAKEVSA